MFRYALLRRALGRGALVSVGAFSLSGCLFYGNEDCVENPDGCGESASLGDGDGPNGGGGQDIGGGANDPDGSGGNSGGTNQAGGGGPAIGGSGGGEVGSGGSASGGDTGSGGEDMGTGGEDMGTGGEDMGTGGGGALLVEYERFLSINEARHGNDYIEIYNGSGMALPLDGIGLTIDSDYSNICWFDSLSSIPSGGFILAREAASCFGGEVCVTGCTIPLSADSSMDLLYDDGTTRHSVQSEYYADAANEPSGTQAWVRVTDGTGNFAKGSPSPGASN